MNTSKLDRLLVGLAVVLVSGILLAACAQKATPQTPVSEAPAATSIEVQPSPTSIRPTSAPESIKLTMWWWGEQNAPGQEGWIKDVIALYEAKNPNVKVEAVLQGTDETIPAYHAAVAAKSGPDIATLWYGMYMWEDVWAGNVTPISDYVSQEEMSHWTGRRMNTFDGKVWAVDLNGDSMAIGYNKKLFAEAGLDPEKPPATWDEFLAACTALSKAGITPVAIGTSDGWLGVVLGNYLLYQTTSDVKGLGQAVIGEKSWTDEPYADMWYRIAEMRDEGCVSKDASSLTYFEAQELFRAGKAAITFPAASSVVSWMREMGQDVVGVMAIPSVTGQPIDWYTTQGMTLFITPWSPHKEQAADFLKFLHSQEAMKSLYEKLGGMVLPADDRFDPNIITSPTVRLIWEKQQAGFQKNISMTDAVIPYAILGDGMMPAISKMFSDNMTPEEAAKMTEAAAENWRKLSPEMLAMYKQWLMDQ